MTLAEWDDLPDSRGWKIEETCEGFVCLLFYAADPDDFFWSSHRAKGKTREEAIEKVLAPFNTCGCDR